MERVFQSESRDRRNRPCDALPMKLTIRQAYIELSVDRGCKGMGNQRPGVRELHDTTRSDSTVS
jgi:hypothetical protein